MTGDALTGYGDSISRRPLEGVQPVHCPISRSRRRSSARARRLPSRLSSSSGARPGATEALENGRLADRTPPRLVTHGRYGQRLDRVELAKPDHACMSMSCAEGLHASAWDGYPGTVLGAHVARAAGLYMAAQMDAGHCRALSMTNASIAALLKAPDLAWTWLPKISIRATMTRATSPFPDKPSATVGLAFTERQSGTDLSETVTAGGAQKDLPAAMLLIGHKWLIFRRPCPTPSWCWRGQEAGSRASCVPRYLPRRHAPMGIHVCAPGHQFFGSRSSATVEVELSGCQAWLVGGEGQGAATWRARCCSIRGFDHAVVAAGLMRSGPRQRDPLR